MLSICLSAIHYDQNDVIYLKLYLIFLMILSLGDNQVADIYARWVRYTAALRIPQNLGEVAWCLPDPHY